MNEYLKESGLKPLPCLIFMGAFYWLSNQIETSANVLAERIGANEKVVNVKFEMIDHEFEMVDEKFKAVNQRIDSIEQMNQLRHELILSKLEEIKNIK